MGKNKKIYTIVFVIMFFVILGLLSFIYIDYKNDKVTTKDAFLDAVYVYDGTQKVIEVNEKFLKEFDSTVAYTNNKKVEVGSYVAKATITGKKDYVFTATLDIIDENVDDDYTLEFMDDKAIITKYSANDNNVIIPNYVLKDGAICKVVGIASNAFSGNKNIKEVVVPKNITQIATSAFANCINLEKVVINSNIKEISDKTFMYCQNLKNVYTTSDITKIGDYAFLGCSALTDFKLSFDLESIGDYAFFSCVSLKSVFISDDVDLIGEYCFNDCYSLTIYNESKSIKQFDNANVLSVYNNVSDDDFVRSGDFEFIIMNDEAVLTRCFASNDVYIPKYITIDSCNYVVVYKEYEDMIGMNDSNCNGSPFYYLDIFNIYVSSLFFEDYHDRVITCKYDNEHYSLKAIIE